MLADLCLPSCDKAIMTVNYFRNGYLRQVKA